MRILFLGDIVGKTGRQMVMDHLPRLRHELRLDVILANAENASRGLGLSANNARELHQAGLDAMTSGNHIWKFSDIASVLDTEPWLLRPANYPSSAPGRGLYVFSVEPDLPPLAVMNLQGRVFMDSLDCPFAAAEKLLEDIPAGSVLVVDMHAEATSEKRALAHMLRGKAQAVLGTHTHVQTNDACILDGVTGFMTDLGMCGPVDSCLGMDSDAMLRKFRTGRPERFEPAAGPCSLQGALMEIREGRCVHIEPWRFEE